MVSTYSLRRFSRAGPGIDDTIKYNTNHAYSTQIALTKATLMTIISDHLTLHISSKDPQKMQPPFISVFALE